MSARKSPGRCSPAWYREQRTAMRRLVEDVHGLDRLLRFKHSDVTGDAASVSEFGARCAADMIPCLHTHRDPSLVAMVLVYALRGAPSTMQADRALYGFLHHLLKVSAARSA